MHTLLSLIALQTKKKKTRHSKVLLVSLQPTWLPSWPWLSASCICVQVHRQLYTVVFVFVFVSTCTLVLPVSDQPSSLPDLDRWRFQWWRDNHFKMREEVKRRMWEVENEERSESDWMWIPNELLEEFLPDDKLETQMKAKFQICICIGIYVCFHICICTCICVSIFACICAGKRDRLKVDCLPVAGAPGATWQSGWEASLLQLPLQFSQSDFSRHSKPLRRNGFGLPLASKMDFRWIALVWRRIAFGRRSPPPAYCPLSFLLFLPFKHRWTLGEIFFVKKCIFPADLSQPRRRVYNLLNFARESRNSVADLHFSLETVGTQGRDARLPQTWSAHGHWT